MQPETENSKIIVFEVPKQEFDYVHEDISPYSYLLRIAADWLDDNQGCDACFPVLEFTQLPDDPEALDIEGYRLEMQVVALEKIVW